MDQGPGPRAWGLDLLLWRLLIRVGNYFAFSKRTPVQEVLSSVGFCGGTGSVLERHLARSFLLPKRHKETSGQECCSCEKL